MSKGRGTQHLRQSRFHKEIREPDPEQLREENEQENLLFPDPKTRFIEVFPKTILNKVESPDVPMDWGLNPYQGCEHGCVYCYARPTHEFWDYNAGLDFESVILLKMKAAELLHREINHPKWVVKPIMLSGNTDCYQPAERKFRLTRQILELLHRFHHPVGIITKNALIERDIDLLSDMARNNLVAVNISLTTLDREIKSKMEPRTSRPDKVLDCISRLRDAGIPVRVLFSPVIPSLTDHELMAVAEAVYKAGAQDFGYQVVRLNGPVEEIFRHWIEKAFPERAPKVLRHIADLHGGKTSDSRFGKRMRGEGIWAESIKSQYLVAKRKFFPDPPVFRFNTGLFEQFREGQMKSVFG
jgi:DNA repair photolyase